jgi:ABC-type amino acid transport substrate-binding protein
MNGRSFVFAFAIALFALPVAAQPAPPDRLEKILHDGVLRVGTTMDTPVFSMRDPATGKLKASTWTRWSRWGRHSASRSNT